MIYRPAFESANLVGTWWLGRQHAASLFNEIKALGSTEYAFSLMVIDIDTGEPRLFVSSEVKFLAGCSANGSHVLTVMHDDRYSEHGSSEAWSDILTFFDAAICIASQRLGISLN